MTNRKLDINRAPVLTLWAAVVAMRLGYDEEASLTLGQAVAALNAHSKGRRLGIYEAGAEGAATEAKKSTTAASVHLLGREIPVNRARGAVRAAPGGESVEPDAVRAYLAKKFGEHLAEARRAMELLAASLSPDELAARGFSLYEKFRPQIPEGKKGWGAKGALDLDLIRRLAR